MITIKVKQDPDSPWPNGWSIITYPDKDRMWAEDHWRQLKTNKNTAFWVENKKEIKRLP